MQKCIHSCLFVKNKTKKKKGVHSHWDMSNPRSYVIRS